MQSVEHIPVWGCTEKLTKGRQIVLYFQDALSAITCAENLICSWLLSQFNGIVKLYLGINLHSITSVNGKRLPSLRGAYSYMELSTIKQPSM